MPTPDPYPDVTKAATPTGLRVAKSLAVYGNAIVHYTVTDRGLVAAVIPPNMVRFAADLAADYDVLVPAPSQDE